MGGVVSIEKNANAEKVLRRLLVGMGQFDKSEEEFIKAVAKECFDGNINPECFIDNVRLKIRKYRQEKLLIEIRMAQVEAAERVVIENLRRRGL